MHPYIDRARSGGDDFENKLELRAARDAVDSDVGFGGRREGEAGLAGKDLHMRTERMVLVFREWDICWMKNTAQIVIDTAKTVRSILRRNAGTGQYAVGHHARSKGKDFRVVSHGGRRKDANPLPVVAKRDVHRHEVANR